MKAEWLAVPSSARNRALRLRPRGDAANPRRLGGCPREKGSSRDGGCAVSGSSRVEIVYCRQCRWLLRAAWMAQELLSTFEGELEEVALIPGSGGIFEIRVATEVVWSRKDKGRFPEIKELKRLVRDRVAPEKDLGHADRPAT